MLTVEESHFDAQRSMFAMSSSIATEKGMSADLLVALGLEGRDEVRN